MPVQSKLKSSLKPAVEKFCSKCFKKKSVRFAFSDLYQDIEQLERNARRVKSVQQLLRGEHVKTSRLILLQIEIKLAIRYLEKKYKKV